MLLVLPRKRPTRHQPHREDFVAPRPGCQRGVYRGLLHEKLAPGSHPQEHPQCGMWVHGSNTGHDARPSNQPDPGKAIPGPRAWSAKIRACIWDKKKEEEEPLDELKGHRSRWKVQSVIFCAPRWDFTSSRGNTTENQWEVDQVAPTSPHSLKCKTHKCWALAQSKAPSSPLIVTCNPEPVEAATLNIHERKELDWIC